mgnify:CR=1 FL=1
MELESRLKAKIREVEDFPKPGISFKDITTLLKEGLAFQEAIDELAKRCERFSPQAVVAPEARGFILGGALAYRLGVGFVPVRKAGKLPAATVSGSYQLEYGTDTLEMHADAVIAGQRVLVFDDLLATGGTICATIDLVKQLGGEVVAAAFLIELTYLPGREQLGDLPVVSIIRY